MKEMRHTATFLYSGAVLAETGAVKRIETPDVAGVLAASPDDRWFAAHVSTAVWTRFTSEEGDVLWKQTGALQTFTVYVGQEYTAEQVEQLPGDHHTLLANMRSNGWAKAVRTRLGNWQPVEVGDIVIPAASVL
jgi:hypothetical protein